MSHANQAAVVPRPKLIGGNWFDLLPSAVEDINVTKPARMNKVALQ